MKQPFGAKPRRSCLLCVSWIAANHGIGGAASADNARFDVSEFRKIVANLAVHRKIWRAAPRDCLQGAVERIAAGEHERADRNGSRAGYADDHDAGTEMPRNFRPSQSLQRSLKKQVSRDR